MSDQLQHGRFTWHDLMTTNVPAAIDYYAKVLGLGTMPFEHDPSYMMWTAGGVPIGGVMALPEEARAMGAPPHWLAYITVDDVDAAFAKAKELGAKSYVEPTSIPAGGKFAVLADPTGGTFGIYAHGGTPPPSGTPSLDFSWHELATTDWQAAWKFYQELFGWEETDSMEMGPGNTYHMFGFAGKSMGGMYNKPPEMAAPPHWLTYADVTDATATADAVKRHGGQVFNGPMEVPGGGHIAQCADPQGAAFAVYAEPAAVAAPKPSKPRTVRKKRKATTAAKKRSAKKTARRKAKKKTVKRKAAKKTKRAGRKKRR